MRRRFCEAATKLLDALTLVPTPAFCVAWPVHRQRIALPSSQQVARALKPIGARLDGGLRTVNDNEAALRSLEGAALWDAMGAAVEVLPPSSVATPCLNANVSWPACVGERR